MKKLLYILLAVAFVAPAAQADNVFTKGYDKIFAKKATPIRHVRQYNFQHPNGRPKEIYSAYTSVTGMEVKHGAYKLYNLNGSIRENGIYQEGLVSKKTSYQWYGSGQKSREEFADFNTRQKPIGRGVVHTWYLNGKPSGDWIYNNGSLTQDNSYYPNGKPKEQHRYNGAGDLNGVQQGWFETGAKTYVYTYLHGSKHGKFMQCNKGFALIRDEDWEEDVLKKSNGKIVAPSQAATNFGVKKPTTATKRRR